MKLIRAIALISSVCSGAFAQSASPLPWARQQFADGNGLPLAGGYVYTCAAGLSCAPGTVGAPALNPLASYTDSTGAVANTNPVQLDSAGRASIWLGSSNYKVVLQDVNGVNQWTADNVRVVSSGAASFGALTVASLAVTGAAAFSSGATFTSGAFSGGLTAQSTNAVLNAGAFAGADLGAKVTAALAACPSTGCTIEVPIGSSGNVSSPINVTKPNVHIRCDGHQVVKFTQTFHGTLPASGSMIYVVNANGFEISNCYLDAAQQNDPYYSTNLDNGLVYTANTNFAHIHDNYFHDGGTNTRSGTQNGVRIAGGTWLNGVSPACAPASITCQNGYLTGSYNEVDHNILDTLPFMAVGAGENGGYNDFHDNYIYAAGEAFDFNGNNVDSPNNRFHHNTVIGYGVESFFESTSGSQVDNNYFYTASNTGALWIHTAIATIQTRSKVSNNIFVGTAANVQAVISVFGNALDTQIIGNQFYGSGGDGIYLGGFGGGGVQRTFIRDNEVLVGNAGPGYCAVRMANTGTVTASDTWITGNDLVAANSGSAICNDAGATPTHAVILGNTAVPITLTGCINCVIGNNEETPGLNISRATLTSRITGSSGTPTLTLGAGAGTSPGSSSIQGNDVDGSVQVVLGSSPPISSTVLSVTFTSPYTSQVFCTITPGSPSSSIDAAKVYLTSPTLAGFSVVTNALPALSNPGTAYVWTYHCGGK